MLSGFTTCTPLSRSKPPIVLVALPTTLYYRLSLIEDRPNLCSAPCLKGHSFSRERGLLAHHRACFYVTFWPVIFCPPCVSINPVTLSAPSRVNSICASTSLRKKRLSDSASSSTL